MVIRAKLCLLCPLHFAHIGAVQLLDFKIIQGHGKLLILVVLEVVVILQFGVFLGFNDALHELHCGIVLTDITFPLRLYDDFLKVLCVWFEFDGESAGSSLGDVYLLFFIAHAREVKRSTVDA